MAVYQFTVFYNADVVCSASVYTKLFAARRYIGVARQNSLTIGRLLYRNLAQTIEPRGKAGRESSRHMLRNNDAWRIGRHTRKYFFDGLGPPR